MGGRKTNIWWMATVEETTKERDKLTEEKGRNSHEWIDACQRLKELIREEKTKMLALIYGASQLGN